MKLMQRRLISVGFACGRCPVDEHGSRCIYYYINGLTNVQKKHTKLEHALLANYAVESIFQQIGWGGRY